jgi:hypothetical protein
MTKRIIATAILFLSFSAPAFADTWKGFITDQMCSKQHKADDPKNIECAKKCLKNGESAVLVVGEKVYKIENQAAIKTHIGRTVTVTGKLTGDTIHIDKITG